jgi:hypothetical protein
MPSSNYIQEWENEQERKCFEGMTEEEMIEYKRNVEDGFRLFRESWATDEDKEFDRKWQSLLEGGGFKNAKDNCQDAE